jgi:hypothetical protein
MPIMPESDTVDEVIEVSDEAAPEEVTVSE